MNRYPRFVKPPIIIIVAVTAFGFIVMGLWNALMPEIFQLPAINFWQAVGLLLLSRILLGGFGGRPSGPFGHRGKRREMMHHLRERWQHMTPEQQEKLRRKWKNRWDVDIDKDITKEPEE